MTQLKIKYKSETAEFINSAKLPEHYSYQIASELLETDVTFPLMWYFSNLIDSQRNVYSEYADTIAHLFNYYTNCM